MTDDLIQRQDEGHIATITLNSPHSLNALSRAMIARLTDELDRLAADRSTRVIILRGAGRAFCAGHDLKEMQAARQSPDKGDAFFRTLFDACAAMMQRLPALPQPVIAEVHGIATAAGCQLAASCDMVVAAEDARFGVNGVNIGLFCSTPMVALTRKVPPAVAFEMLTTGDFLPAPRARDVGLVNRVAPPDLLSHETRKLAETLAAKLTAAVHIGKRTFYDQQGLSLSDAYALTGDRMTENMLWRDTEEGIAAFLEKRKPDWA
jgi:enoyl-CoA hydratase/carnithine racemase